MNQQNEDLLSSINKVPSGYYHRKNDSVEYNKSKQTGSPKSYLEKY